MLGMGRNVRKVFDFYIGCIICVGGGGGFN